MRARERLHSRVERINAKRLLGKVGTVEQQPIAISGQYHFGEADNVFRPFVGVGYYESNFLPDFCSRLTASV